MKVGNVGLIVEPNFSPLEVGTLVILMEKEARDCWQVEVVGGKAGYSYGLLPKRIMEVPEDLLEGDIGL